MAKGPLVRTRGVKPSTGNVLLDHPSQLAPQRRGVGQLQVEDRRADVPDRHVEVGNRVVEPSLQVLPRCHTTCALKVQPRREEPLDHQVVEVSRDAVPVGDEHQFLTVRHGQRPVQRQRGLVGERRQQLRLVSAGRSAAGLEDYQQDAGVDGVGAQRHKHAVRSGRRGARRTTVPRSPRGTTTSSACAFD
jgi:hypothetical protein